MKTKHSTPCAATWGIVSRLALAPLGALLALAALAPRVPAAAQAPSGSWSFVGPQGLTPGVAISGDIEVDGRGRLYTSYKALFREDTRASVRTWNVIDQRWDLVGPEGAASAGNAWYNDLAFTDADELLICQRDYALLGGLGVRLFADGAWAPLPTASPDDAHYTRIAVSRNSTPVVVYQDRSTVPPDGPTVRCFSRTSQSWELLGPPGFTAATSGYHSLAIDGLGVPHVAFTSAAHGDRVCVLSFDSSTETWTPLGSSEDVSPPGVHHAMLAFDGLGRLHLAYHVWQDRIEVKRWEAGKWVRLGAAGSGGASGGNRPELETEHWRQWLSLAFDSESRPYVAYQLLGDGRPVVRRYDEAQSRWLAVGPVPFHDAPATYLRMTIGHDDTVYAAFSDAAVGGKWSVMQFR